ncbi:YtxH domain-containing protein [Flavobacterium sp. N1994]|uniref:YtxH domain-containing protein n=1 Tax=Flavobacterium sp. N1994 TaxID=2986827 RepID=UPI00222131E5|nr:YtxH domain-containing protein [Flavobacterium sp. N1994]
MKTSTVVLGVLGGVAVGALAGVLFAPAKGTKTRKRIMKKGSDYTKDLKNKFEDLYGNIATQYENVMEDAKEFVSDHQEK